MVCSLDATSRALHVLFGRRRVVLFTMDCGYTPPNKKGNLAGCTSSSCDNGEDMAASDVLPYVLHVCTSSISHVFEHCAESVYTASFMLPDALRPGDVHKVSRICAFDLCLVEDRPTGSD
mmetsp:Transcript_52438/g.97079  ORF Transcript_52438/g.97079 Transcript_52438/m.97079 type:complete len:120 (+) Transcript_52438:581-940(+)